MLVIKKSDFDEYGCIECGADNYVRVLSQENNSTLISCLFCSQEFFICKNDDKDIEVLYDTKIIDENGKSFSIPIKLSSHPREGIPKLQIAFDLRIAENKGEFCIPKHIGLELTCLARSHESAKRIVEMIDKVSEESQEKTFTAKSYDTTVKIGYTDVSKGFVLYELLKENNDIISEDLLINVINMEFNFINTWKYDIKNYIINLDNTSYMKYLYSNNQKDIKDIEDIYEINPDTFNFIEIFELFGIYLQIEKSLRENNKDMACEVFLHILDNYGEPFNWDKRETILLKENKKSSKRANLNTKLTELVSKYYNQENIQLEESPEKRYNSYLERAVLKDNDKKEEFKTRFDEEIRPLIESLVDQNYLDNLTEYRSNKINSLLDNLGENVNIIAQFLLYGLLIEIDKQFSSEREDYYQAVMALDYVASRFETPLYLKLNLDKQEAYLLLQDKLNKLYNDFYISKQTYDKCTDELPYVKKIEM